MATHEMQQTLGLLSGALNVQFPTDLMNSMPDFDVRPHIYKSAFPEMEQKHLVTKRCGVQFSLGGLTLRNTLVYLTIRFNWVSEDNSDSNSKKEDAWMMTKILALLKTCKIVATLTLESTAPNKAAYIARVDALARSYVGLGDDIWVFRDASVYGKLYDTLTEDVQLKQLTRVFLLKLESITTKGDRVPT
ncbi:hypothetical protein P3342_003605 [Pyrenophora teres f. teres]|uniref:Uncharacterized protein n=2 Tax=Pyrenophora teres f. teres TaxID=97479 RepID=E3S0R3_PYRTT|nr:hypothetical protein PTT_15689 [Pyrenophora teres f. teres 0-1]KAE8842792.1 hypothetical protein HRS9139_02089 [Pyrenophora teres f. teres]KAE8850149.1 hypothetical protein PTNB85_00565 [Pyrenophora teres f. teres]KAE8851826.1 hypothetical protein HRS9122_02113 [Pyrenophora teres f. teres]KAE8870491.1 hypothetical protein PTNB29_00835 [Pyrenophora teres f. teres]